METTVRFTEGYFKFIEAVFLITSSACGQNLCCVLGTIYSPIRSRIYKLLLEKTGNIMLSKLPLLVLNPSALVTRERFIFSL
jgi:hypothetical protein